MNRITTKTPIPYIVGNLKNQFNILVIFTSYFLQFMIQARQKRSYILQQDFSFLLHYFFTIFVIRLYFNFSYLKKLIKLVVSALIYKINCFDLQIYFLG